MANAVCLARRMFTYDGVCEVNFTLSHRKRIEINRKCKSFLAARCRVDPPRPTEAGTAQRAAAHVGLARAEDARVRGH